MTARTIGVAGLGLLGRGVAACLLGHGFRVTAFTRRPSTHAEARQYLAGAMDDLVAQAGFPARLRHEWADRYEPVPSPDRLALCDFVIESVAEDLAVKRQTFDALEAVVRPDVPIASNTSALPIGQLQAGRRHPERLLGMHWAEPAHATRFMEIIRGPKTSDAAFHAAMELARAIGKEPCEVQKDLPAFLVNRIGYAMYREALYLLEQGVADAETIDRSCRNALGLFATLCGPLRWIDLSGGPALYAKAMAGVLPTLNNAAELPETIRRLAESGARGIANGRGFYAYTPEECRQWEDLFRQHAWKVKELHDQYFPLADQGP